MNEVISQLISRRSVRRYQSTPIPREMLDSILEAGTYAPSGLNNQKAILVAVTNKEVRDRLSRLNAAVIGIDSDPFYGAPCVIVVLSQPGQFTWLEDGSLVLGNLLNAAHALGLGSCWIHRAREVFDTPEGRQLLQEWGLPETLRGIGNCIIGYADEVPGQKPRLAGRIVHID